MSRERSAHQLWLAQGHYALRRGQFLLWFTSSIYANSSNTHQTKLFCSLLWNKCFKTENVARSHITTWSWPSKQLRIMIQNIHSVSFLFVWRIPKIQCCCRVPVLLLPRKVFALFCATLIWICLGGLWVPWLACNHLPNPPNPCPFLPVGTHLTNTVLLHSWESWRQRHFWLKGRNLMAVPVQFGDNVCIYLDVNLCHGPSTD